MGMGVSKCVKRRILLCLSQGWLVAHWCPDYIYLFLSHGQMLILTGRVFHVLPEFVSLPAFTPLCLMTVAAT